MGIGGLTTLLEPYRTPVVFPRDLAVPTDVYIDGPGFAYWCWETDSPYRKPTENSDGGDYAGFLERVEAHLHALSVIPNFHIRNLIFDGYLPILKKETRLRRMNDSVWRIHNFKKNHTRDYTRVLPFTDGWNEASRTTKLSPPPFIVSVLLDYLRASKWAELVQTVWGEADAYCAAKALGGSKKGAIVLTNDSDLLLFRYKKKDAKMPPSYAVVMFRDLLFEEGNILKASAFYVGAIEEELKVQLIRIAFQVKESPGNFPRMSVLQENASKIKGPSWNLFELEFELPSKEIQKEECPVVSPRIAEVFYNIQLAKDGVAEAYHPILWEDTATFPAYDVGTSIRALAYSVLNSFAKPYNKDIMKVAEYGRRGVTVHPKELDLIDKRGDALVDYLDGLLPALEDIPAFLLKQVLTPYIERDSALPPKAALLAMIQCTQPTQSVSSSKTPQSNNVWNWNQTHLFAAWQAAVYSLYVLKESCRVVFTTVGMSSTVGKLRALSKVYQLLKHWDWYKWINGEIFLATMGTHRKSCSPQSKKLVDEVLHWAQNLPDATEDEDEEMEVKVKEEEPEEEEEDAADDDQPAGQQAQSKVLTVPEEDWKPVQGKRKHTKTKSDSSEARGPKFAKSSQNPFNLLGDMD